MNRTQYIKNCNYVGREEVETYLSNIIMELNLRQLCDTDISTNKVMLWVEGISITDYESAKERADKYNKTSILRWLKNILLGGFSGIRKLLSPLKKNKQH